MCGERSPATSALQQARSAASPFLARQNGLDEATLSKGLVSGQLPYLWWSDNPRPPGGSATDVCAPWRVLVLRQAEPHIVGIRYERLPIPRQLAGRWRRQARTHRAVEGDLLGRLRWRPDIGLVVPFQCPHSGVPRQRPSTPLWGPGGASATVIRVVVCRVTLEMGTGQFASRSLHPSTYQYHVPVIVLPRSCLVPPAPRFTDYSLHITGTEST